jgi:hypothetical protein
MYSYYNNEVEPIKIFKTRSFAQWAKKEKMTDLILRGVIDQLVQGLVNVDLGGGLVKKRVARSGQGKRGGYRTLLAFKRGERAVFIFGFSKNDRENIDNDEKHIYKKLCRIYLEATEKQLEVMCDDKKLFEINYEEM